MKSTATSIITKPEQYTPEWFVVDATGMVVGRLAAKIAEILMGKHKPTYTPHVDTGDYVIVLNADKVRFTGGDMHHPRYKYYTSKFQNKKYITHSLWPGGLKVRSAMEMWDRKPTHILEMAVRRMLPKNALGRHMLDKLKLFAAAEHTHQAQCPKPLPECWLPR